MKYKIEVYDHTGGLLADLSDRCISREITLRKNRPDFIRLSFDLEDIDRYLGEINQNVNDIFAVGRNEVRVFKRNKLVSSGQIDYISTSFSQAGMLLVVNAVGWFHLLDKRITGIADSYNDDIGQIMWDLIDTTQSLADGDIGITLGTIQASRNGERNYELKNMKDAIIQLSEVIGGPDFEITPEKVFNVYSPKIGIRRPDVVFTYPDSIFEIGYTLDADTMANEITASGAGFGAERLLSTSVDTVNRSTYGLRQKLTQYPDVSIQNTLDEHAVEDLRTRTNPLVIAKLRVDGDRIPVFSSYGIGDEIKIQATRFQPVLEPILGWQRVESIDVSIDKDDTERIDLGLVKP